MNNNNNNNNNNNDNLKEWWGNTYHNHHHHHHQQQQQQQQLQQHQYYQLTRHNAFDINEDDAAQYPFSKNFEQSNLYTSGVGIGVGGGSGGGGGGGGGEGGGVAAATVLTSFDDSDTLARLLTTSRQHTGNAIVAAAAALPQRMVTSTAVPQQLLGSTFTTNIENLVGSSVSIIGNNVTIMNPYDGDTEENAIPSLTLLLMAISYGLVVFGGVLGNATLVLTLCSTSSTRLRNPLNPLLLGVCIADLLVTGISAPVTLLNLAMNRKTRSLPLLVCKLIHYIQVMPVAASTISFFMLSLDRYATVKHPKLAQLRQRRYLHVTLALLSWIASAAISVPFLFAYKIIAKTVIIKNASDSSGIGGGGGGSGLSGSATSYTETIDSLTSMAIADNDSKSFTTSSTVSGIDTTSAIQHSQTASPNVSISCTSDIGAGAVFVSFIIFHTIAVFIIPGVGVLLNHYGVRRKLCALSLTARAAHGELPLPMPRIAMQTHMVIVTGIANAQQAAGCGATDDTSNCGIGGDGGGDDGEDCGDGTAVAGDIQLHNLNPKITLPKRSIVKTSNPISPRAMREIRAHSQRQRIHHNRVSRRGPAAPGIPLPQTSTLRSRRRLANMLIASAIIFIACWSPHVFCIFYKNFGYKQYCSKTSTYFNLLLGYLYSALSPVIYWALNHNTLRQSPCAPLIRLRSMQNFLRTRFRSHTVPPPPSSTNEANLGAFNPKLIKLTPKQYRAQASSHYLY